jgi:hypothetical protein
MVDAPVAHSRFENEGAFLGREAGKDLRQVRFGGGVARHPVNQKFAATLRRVGEIGLYRAILHQFQEL